MKTITLLIMFSFIGSQCYTTNDVVGDYIYNKRVTNEIRITDKNAERYTQCIYKYSDKYGLDPILIARQIYKESRFKHTASNKWGAFGPMQVRVKFWKHVLYRIDNGDLGKYLLSRATIDHSRYFKRIGYGIESGCYIMSHASKKYKSYPLALVSYWTGGSSDIFKRAVNDSDYLNNLHYVKDIIND